MISPLIYKSPTKEEKNDTLVLRYYKLRLFEDSLYILNILLKDSDIFGKAVRDNDGQFSLPQTLFTAKSNFFVYLFLVGGKNVGTSRNDGSKLHFSECKERKGCRVFDLNFTRRSKCR